MRYATRPKVVRSGQISSSSWWKMGGETWSKCYMPSIKTQNMADQFATTSKHNCSLNEYVSLHNREITTIYVSAYICLDEWILQDKRSEICKVWPLSLNYFCKQPRRQYSKSCFAMGCRMVSCFGKPTFKKLLKYEMCKLHRALNKTSPVCVALFDTKHWAIFVRHCKHITLLNRQFR